VETVKCVKKAKKAALSVSGVKSSDCGMLYLIVNEQKNRCNNNSKAIAAVGHDTGEFKASKFMMVCILCQYDRKYLINQSESFGFLKCLWFFLKLP
jgi:hypothetical protein